MSSVINSVDLEQFKTGIFFRMTVRRPGNRAKVKDLSALEAYLDLLHADNNNGDDTGLAVDVPKNFKGGDGCVKVTKKLLLGKKPTKEDPNPDPYVNACAFLNEAKERLVGRFGKALPSKISEGLFVVRKDLVTEFEEELNATLRKLQDDYIPALRDDYPLAKERAKNTPVKQGGLGPLYREADYAPISEFLAAFSIEWQWLSLSVPEDLPEALRQEQTEKMQRQFAEAADEVRQALRAAFAELIEHASEKLKPAEPGAKQSVFRDSLIGNIQQFCEVFEAKNIMNDSDLAGLVAQAKEVLLGVNADRLRKYANVRQATQEKFNEIKAQLDAMITTRKGRVIDLSED